ncbi:MAG: hypothetical protein KDI45_06025 [Candidatus Accumulibacter sp.]|nr:hypothetical protein [Accumulibacter sp.]
MASVDSVQAPLRQAFGGSLTSLPKGIGLLPPRSGGQEGHLVKSRYAEAPVTASALVDEVPADRDDALFGAKSIQRFLAGRWVQRFDGKEMESHRSLN